MIIYNRIYVGLYFHPIWTDQSINSCSYDCSMTLIYVLLPCCCCCKPETLTCNKLIAQNNFEYLVKKINLNGLP